MPDLRSQLGNLPTADPVWEDLEADAMKLNRRVWQISILAIWALFVVVYVCLFHISPAHDEDYGKWLFFSLLDTAGPWLYCSAPIAIIVLSLESRHRARRMWTTLTWAAIVICFAWAKLQPIFQSGPPAELGIGRISSTEWTTMNVEGFVTTWLFPALVVLAALLWIEKMIVKRGLLA